MQQRIRRTTRSICAASVPAEGRAAPIEVSISLVDDAAIRILNAYWRGHDKPTDVLAFGQPETPMPSWAMNLGDVVISIESAKRQARRHRLSDEVIILLVHGLMHLLGYDHNTPVETARMLAAETRFLAPRRLRSGLGQRA